MNTRFGAFVVAALLAGCAGSVATQSSHGATLPSADTRGRPGGPSSGTYIFVTNDTTDMQGSPAEVDYWPIGSTRCAAYRRDKRHKHGAYVRS
jgi:hypothetical protein